MKEVISYKNSLEKILKIAIPVMLQSMIGYILVFIDTAFIGNYRLEGLSAINNVMIPFFTIGALFIAFSQGLTILLSQEVGAKRRFHVKRVCENGFLINQTIALLYFFFWYVLGPHILRLVGAKGEVLILAEKYLKILSFIYLFNGFSLTAVAIFQGFGRTTPILISSLIKSTLNIFLNWILIYGKLGFPCLGIMGAALGTVISDFVGTIYLITSLYLDQKGTIEWGKILTVNSGIIRQLFIISIPIGIDYILWHIGQLFIIYIMNKINSTAAGAFGVINVLTNLSFNLYIGLGIASLVLVGNAKGANEHKSIFRIVNICLLLSFSLCLLLSIIFILFPGELLGIFTKDTEFIKMLVRYIPYLGLIIIPKAVNVVTGHAIKGLGDTKWLVKIQALGTLLIIIGTSFIYKNYQLGFTGILIVLFGDEFWRSSVNYLKFYNKYSCFK